MGSNCGLLLREEGKAWRTSIGTVWKHVCEDSGDCNKEINWVC